MTTEWQIEIWPIDRFRPYERNPRKNDHVVAQMEASIREFGFKIPMLARSDGEVVDGHLRLKAALNLKLQELPTILCDEWTPAQVKAFRIMVNKSVEWADWDADLLNIELGELKELEFDLNLTGFELGEIGGLLDKSWEPPSRESQKPVVPTVVEGQTDEDATPETPAMPVTVPGDLWLLGEHRVLCGDSTAIDAVERLCGGSQVDMVWTDPPYGVSYIGKTADALTIQNDSLDDAGLEDFLRGALGCALLACREGGSWYVAAPAGPLHNVFGTVLKELGIWRQTLNWVKSVFVMGRSDYHYRHEPIFYGWKPGASHYFIDDRTQDTVLQFDKPSRSAEHPTMKPVALVRKCIENSSKAGQAVLDLFGGSGTTLLACEESGRLGRLMELDPRYVDVIVKRWQEFSGKQAVLEGDGRTFDAIATLRVQAVAA